MAAEPAGAAGAGHSEWTREHVRAPRIRRKTVADTCRVSSAGDRAARSAVRLSVLRASLMSCKPRPRVTWWERTEHSACRSPRGFGRASRDTCSRDTQRTRTAERRAEASSRRPHIQNVSSRVRWEGALRGSAGLVKDATLHGFGHGRSPEGNQVRRRTHGGRRSGCRRQAKRTMGQARVSRATANREHTLTGWPLNRWR